MKRSYVEELGEWVKDDKKKNKRADGTASFLAAKKDIIEAMSYGYDKKTIWKNLTDSGRFHLRYESFLRYIKKHITKDDIESKKLKDNAPAPESSGPKKVTPKKHEGFQFSAKPNTEDLI